VYGIRPIFDSTAAVAIEHGTEPFNVLSLPVAEEYISEYFTLPFFAGYA